MYGLAYCGTGNLKVLQKLLNISSSDVNNEVRLTAIISIGFLMINNEEKGL